MTNISDLEIHEVGTAQLAVNAQVEEGEFSHTRAAAVGWR
jgi:hypothetical protein